MYIFDQPKKPISNFHLQKKNTKKNTNLLQTNSKFAPENQWLIDEFSNFGGMAWPIFHRRLLGGTNPGSSSRFEGLIARLFKGNHWLISPLRPAISWGVVRGRGGWFESSLT